MIADIDVDTAIKATAQDIPNIKSLHTHPSTKVARIVWFYTLHPKLVGRNG